MKITLLASLLAVSLAHAQPADSGPPPKASSHKFCELPAAPVAKDAPSYPLGGISAPDVGCHDDKNKLKDLGKVKNVRFKLFVSPGRGCRTDYVWNKPNEIQAACKNACIEQRKHCTEKYAKHDKVKTSQCAAQEKACLETQGPSPVVSQKAKCDVH